MAAIIEVEYFNTYVLKHIETKDPGFAAESDAFYTLPQVTFEPVFPGLGQTPDYTRFPVYMDRTPNYPGETYGNPPVDTNFITNTLDWYVEESRIRGGYNNVSTDLGVRAYLEEEEPIQQHRFNALIYSGLYNSQTGFNGTNQFIVGESITRALDPVNGQIKKLYAEDTNLIVFQQDKVNRALIDKDTIYTTEGGTSTLPPGQVIGQITPYLGQYGISDNPESFAAYGYSKYFADKNRGTIMRLSRDGLTEISNYGMLDWFRDNLAALPLTDTAYTVTAQVSNPPIVSTNPSSTIKLVLNSLSATNPVNSEAVISLGSQMTIVPASGPSVAIQGSVQSVIEDTGNNTVVVEYSNTFTLPSNTTGYSVIFTSLTNSRIVGGWDIHNKQYVVSLQATPAYITQESNSYSTLSFDESINGWVSFFTYKPTFMGSLKNKYYTFHKNELYQHYYDNPNGVYRGRFYGVDSPSKITFVFNPVSSTRKNFKTINYEGSNGWEVVSFIGDKTEKIPLYDSGVVVSGSWTSVEDSTSSVYSYEQGYYTENGIPKRAGFNRQQNLYVANLINNTSPSQGEIIYGNYMTGIKGYYATVTVQTDTVTDNGGVKELFQVGSLYTTI